MIVKLVPADLAEIVGGAVAGVVLHVTPNLVPKLESSCTNIWLFAVTTVVSTTTVVVDAATTTDPLGADAHTAGEAEELQLLAELSVSNV